MGFVQPLDLFEIFVNQFAGSMEIFMFLAFIMIAILAAIFKMPNIVAGTMFLVFTIYMVTFSTQGRGSAFFGFAILGLLLLMFSLAKALQNLTK